MCFLPPICALQFFRPALRQRPATEQGFRLRDLAEQTIMGGALVGLKQLGVPLTDENIERERQECARLYEKYS